VFVLLTVNSLAKSKSLFATEMSTETTEEIFFRDNNCQLSCFFGKIPGDRHWERRRPGGSSVGKQKFGEFPGSAGGTPALPVARLNAR